MQLLLDEIEIVPFDFEHIPEKVRWYNDEEISRYLHYEEKFTIEGLCVMNIQPKFTIDLYM